MVLASSSVRWRFACDSDSTTPFRPGGPARRMLKSWPSTSDPFREADRAVVRELTVAAFEGVSIDHNIDLRLGPIAGRDWRWRKSRDIDRDIDVLGAELAVAEDEQTGAVVGYVTMQCDPETRIGWIHNLVVGDGGAGPGAGAPVDRARPGAFPRRRHDGGQDRDARAEPDRPAPVPVGRVHRGCPADSLRHASDGSTHS